MAQWPRFVRGATTDVAASGDYAYITGLGPSLTVVSVADPTNATIVGQVLLEGNARTVDLTGTLVAVGTETAGLYLIDVSLPERPAILGRYATNARVTDVCLRGNLAYAALPAEGLHILDVADPRNPQVLGRSASSTGAYVIALDGDRAAVANYWGTTFLLNVADPTQPVEVGRIDLVGTYTAATKGHFAYLAADFSGIRVFDITNPKAPVLVRTIAIQGGSVHVQVHGDYLYSVGAWDEFGRYGVDIFDLADPSNPLRVARRDASETHAGFCVDGQRLYLADYQDGLGVLEVRPTAATNALSIDFLGRMKTTGSTRCIRVADNRAYLADRAGGVWVFDVSEAGCPIPLTQYMTPWEAHNLVASKETLFVSMEDRWAYAGSLGLQFLDIRNPTKPTELWVQYRTSPCWCSAATLSLDGSNLFVAGGIYTAWLYDVTTVTNPSLAYLYGSGFNEPIGLYSAQTRSNYAYIAGGVDGFWTLLMAGGDPVYHVLKTEGRPEDIHLVGNLAFLANGDSGLFVADVTDPTKPAKVGACPLPTHAAAVRVAGNYAYVAGWSGGVHVVDVRDPANPRWVATGATRTAAVNVEVVDNYVYASIGEGGMEVLRFDEDTRQPQSIMWGPWPERASAGSSVILDVAASSGLPVSLQVVSGPATLEGNRLNLTNTGEVVMTAIQAGTTNYQSATGQRTVTVFGDWAALVTAQMQADHPQWTADQCAPLADPDQDGVPNGLEWLLGTLPDTAEANAGRLRVANVAATEGTRVVELAFRAPLVITPDWRLEWCSTLASPGWQAVPREAIEQKSDRVRATFPDTQSNGFLRLRLQIASPPPAGAN